MTFSYLDLKLTEEAHELKAQLQMLCNTSSVYRAKVQNYDLSFHPKTDVPAMVVIKGTSWVIMEQYIDGKFNLIGINSRDPNRIKLISSRFLADILSKIHEGLCDLVY